MLIYRIRKKQVKFLGYMMRKVDKENWTLIGHIEGKLNTEKPTCVCVCVDRWQKRDVEV